MTLILIHPGFLIREVKAITITTEAKRIYTMLSDVIYSDQCLLNNALMNASETSLVGILPLFSIM